MGRSRIDPTDFDDGIRDSVIMLWNGGFKTFTCCEGGRGHAFRFPTIGLNFTGDYFKFRDRLAAFLISKDCRAFEISLMTVYHPSHRKPRDRVYLEGLDLLSRDKYLKVSRAIKRRDTRLLRLLEQSGYATT
jgi:hypothetical protein